MTVEKIKPSGALLISDIIDNHLVQRIYYGYTKKQAEKKFAEEFSKQNQPINDGITV